MNKYGVLIISHGSRNSEWVRLVDEAVAAVSLPVGIPIVSSYLEIVEGRLIQDGIDQLEAEGANQIIVVPLFVSSGSTHMDEIHYAFGEIPAPNLPTELKPFRLKAKVHFCSPIDEDPIAAQIMYSKIKELSTEPKRESVMLIGHGSAEEGFYQKWHKGLAEVAKQLKAIAGFDRAQGAMLLPDQVAVTIKQWQESQPSHTIIIAPLFLSEGYFTEKVIPARLSGYTYRYNGRSMLPSPLISRWMEAQISYYIKD